MRSALPSLRRINQLKSLHWMILDGLDRWLEDGEMFRMMIITMQNRALEKKKRLILLWERLEKKMCMRKEKLIIDAELESSRKERWGLMGSRPNKAGLIRG
ncbi:hypothetical protein LINPERPRIM_LOCUS22196, partial [Linum perenne]